MDKYIDLLCKLIAVPSFSREEGKAADVLEDWMKGAGYPVRRKGNNLWVRSWEDPSSADFGREPAKVILLNAHLDTVRPSSGYARDPFSPSVEDGRIYGLGSNDDGGSLVALLSAYKTLTGKLQPYGLIWSATAEEEVCGKDGIESVIPEFGPVDLGIIGEPTGMDMAVAERGLMVLDCTAFGKSGHAARDEGENAIYKAMRDIDWFRKFRFEDVSPFLGPVKMTVTQIEAGTQHNVIPDICKFVVDVRSNGLYSNVEILETAQEAVGCQVVARSTRLNSSSIDESHPVVARGRSLGLRHFGSPTTSNQAVISGFPTIKIGPGDSSRSHTADEFIEISEIEEGAETYVKLLDELKI
ncbi:MAG: M20/M25/M40 family metallo-hydrolase [Bacteroidales bacterium]|nr:M20/M25/M40 family metallo-hydrolase [Bacteroidales bacterium]